MALHALAYCERLFYLEEVEEIRVASDAVYAGRVLHQELERPDPTQTEQRSLDVASETLGLTGRVDAVRHRDGGWVPYEHKRGRCARAASKEPAAWPSDRLQVLAYALLLEEANGGPVSEGRIRYHASNVTVRVPVDEQARSDVAAAVVRARALRTISTRPPVTDNERLCIRCSLAPVCLPEEERLARDATWAPIRLFPPAPEGQVIHAVSRDAHVGRSANTLVVKTEEGDQSFPVEQVRAVVLHGFAQMTTQALHLCGSRGIPVHWITGGGRYVGGLALGAGPVQRRIWQYEGLRDPHLRLILARRLVAARIEGQLRYLLRASRERAVRTDLLRDALAEMRMHLKAAQVELDVDILRGHEGATGRRYFDCVPLLLRPDLPGLLIPYGRNRRPPRDRFNALLSYGYGLLYRSVLEAVVAVGLEPAFGFFHTPRSAAHPLVMDVMELFRVPIWDVPVIGSVNRLAWNPMADFTVAGQAVWLSESGRKKAIALYEQRLADTWRHPVVQYSLSYERTIELEVRLLEKEWAGEPGLFARARLR
jgi:CRISPR-associated protein Cas1